jgi:hypothetical protein
MTFLHLGDLCQPHLGWMIRFPGGTGQLLTVRHDLDAQTLVTWQDMGNVRTTAYPPGTEVELIGGAPC